jgi:hypothetical protein
LSKPAAQVFCTNTCPDSYAGKVEDNDPPRPCHDGLFGDGICISVVPPRAIAQRFAVSQIQREDNPHAVPLARQSKFRGILHSLQTKNDLVHACVNEWIGFSRDMHSGVDVQVKSRPQQLHVKRLRRRSSTNGIKICQIKAAKTVFVLDGARNI